MNQRHLLKIDRWTKILLILQKLDFLQTSQIEQLFDLKKKNTLRILRDMREERLLQSKRLGGEWIWYLSKQGRNWIQSDKKVKFITNQIDHYIIRNQVYIHYKPYTWVTETPIKWAHKEIIKPDAIFSHNKNLYFLEVDHKQHMLGNKNKIAKYKKMKESQVLQKQYGQFPIILYVTVSEHRLKELRGLLNNMKAEVLLYKDIK